MVRRSLLQIRYQPRENLFRQRENDVAQFLGVKEQAFCSGSLHHLMAKHGNRQRFEYSVPLR